MTLLTGLALYFFTSYLSHSLDDPEPSVTSAAYDPAEVEILLDESYWWLAQGETEIGLEKLEDLIAYCEMTGATVPTEAEELYDDALQEWLLFSVPPDPSPAPTGNAGV